MTSTLTMMWIGFGIVLVALLAIDLLVLNRGSHVITARKALLQWGMWIVVALLANVAVYFIYLHWYLPVRVLPDPLPSNAKYPATAWEAATMFLQPYLIEQTLSMDNMLVIALLMQYFCIPAQYQHRVLFWGIIGAVVLRGSMIIVGAELVTRFSWMSYVFGAVLLFTALKMLLAGNKEPDLEHSKLIRMTRAVIPVSMASKDNRFLTRENGKLLATPMLLALIVIDFADAIFAIDSIPATFTFTTDVFLAFTANCFAVLGLRALYFGVAALIERFVYMKNCLILLLAFIGVKMLIPHKWLHDNVPHAELWSLGIVLATLGAGVFLSLLFPTKKHPHAPAILPYDDSVKHLE